MPNRGVVVKPLRAGDPLGQPLQDRAYLTPRFPEGIKRNELRLQTPEIQRETILIWFLLNYERPRGRYIGFRQASGASPAEPKAHVLDGGIPLDRGFLLDGGVRFDGSARFDGGARFDGSAPELRDVEVGGFDQAAFYDVGEAVGFLDAEFTVWVGSDVLNGVAEALSGQWVPKQDVLVPPTGAGAEELRSALARILDEFDTEIRHMPVRAVDRWHNQPPEPDRLSDEVPVLGPEERDRVLRATSEMRMAVLSEDYSLATVLWQGVAPALATVSAFVQEQALALVGDIRKVLASAARLVVLAGIAWAFGLLDHAEAISAVMKALHLH